MASAPGSHVVGCAYCGTSHKTRDDAVLVNGAMRTVGLQQLEAPVGSKCRQHIVLQARGHVDPQHWMVLEARRPLLDHDGRCQERASVRVRARAWAEFRLDERLRTHVRGGVPPFIMMTPAKPSPFGCCSAMSIAVIEPWLKPPISTLVGRSIQRVRRHRGGGVVVGRAFCQRTRA